MNTNRYEEEGRDIMYTNLSEIGIFRNQNCSDVTMIEYLKVSASRVTSFELTEVLSQLITW